MRRDRAVCGSVQCLLERGRGLEPCLGHEPVQPRVVHQPGFPAQQSVEHAPAPADVLGCGPCLANFCNTNALGRRNNWKHLS